MAKLIIKEDLLKKQEFFTKYKISPRALELLPQGKTELYLEKIADDLVLTLKHEIYGKKVVKEFKYPATWWDSFKLKFFPKWLLKKYSAKYSTITFNAYALFPDFPIDETRDKINVVHYGELNK